MFIVQISLQSQFILYNITFNKTKTFGHLKSEINIFVFKKN